MKRVPQRRPRRTTIRFTGPDGVTYQGKCWAVKLRIRAHRLDVDGNPICGAVSEGVTLQKVVAVDP